MKYLMLILIGVGVVLTYKYDFVIAGAQECRAKFPHCVKVEERVR